jgi:plasmid stability protein
MTKRDEEWETEDVQLAKPVGVVVSVRVPQDLAEQLYEEAARQGIKASALVREALQQYLTAEVRPATVDLTISSADGPVTFYTGRSSQGKTMPARSTVHLVET